VTAPPPALVEALADRYRIEREIGAGGMASVYLAEDLRHHRRVALKVLKPELAAVIGAARFLAEIKTTANLEHPHLLPLFDSGQSGGSVFYVMPFVEGESLRDRLARERQLPIEDALRIAREVGDALQYAHSRGVIHRDIKPENILLQGGHARVADFGVALAAANTAGARLTETGVSLGTPTYMSPEQAMGERAIDARSDVYALGCVVYEMLTGEAPFSGPTAQAIVAKILTQEPEPIRPLRGRVPPAVEAAVLTALEKLPADRFASAADFVAALDGSAVNDSGARLYASGPRNAVRSTRGTLLGVGGAGLVLGALLTLAVGSGAGGADGGEPSRLMIVDPEATAFFNGTQRTVAITRDGRSVVYAVNAATGGSKLLLRRLDAARAEEIPGSANAANIRLSPDGRYLYSSLTSGAMQRMPLGGGSWSLVPGVAATPFLAIGEDGTHWWTDPLGVDFHRTDPSGRDTVVARGVGIQSLLPGGRFGLALGYSFAQSSGDLRVVDVATGQLDSLLSEDIVEARYAAGYLVWVRADNVMFAAPFDPASRRLLGPPVEIADDLTVSGAGLVQWDVSDNGTVVYLPGTASELVEVTRAGEIRRVVDETARYHSPRYSPEGSRIALDVVRTEGRDVFVYSRDGRERVRATSSGDGHDPVWSKDGGSLLHLAGADSLMGLFSVRLGSTQPPQRIDPNVELAYTGQPIGRTGEYLVMLPGSRGRGNDIARLRGDRIEPLNATEADELYAVPSPDGRWYAFVTDNGGRAEVFVRSLTGADAELQVSQEGGSEPMWSADGRELYFRGETPRGARLIAARLELGASPRVLSRTELFDVQSFDTATPHANYDVSPDGQRFVFVRRTWASGVTVIQNLPELARRLGQAAAGR
jgi:serine/threonine-protein kinase